MTENQNQLPESTQPSEPKKVYKKRKGEFNDLTLEDMLKKVAEYTLELKNLKEKIKIESDAVVKNSLLERHKEILHTRVRAYTRIKKLGGNLKELNGKSE